MITVSYSSVSTYNNCIRQFYYKYVENKIPIYTDDATDTGGWGHKLLENYFAARINGASHEEARAGIVDILPELDLRTPPMWKAWVLVDYYLENQVVEFEETEIVEETFLVPIGNDITVSFLPDRVYRQINGKLVVEDYKFTGRMWSKVKIDRYSQLKLYTAWLRMCGYEVEKSLLRIFNTETDNRNKLVRAISSFPTEKELERLLDEFKIYAEKIVEYMSLPDTEKEKKAIRTLNAQTCVSCKFSLPCKLQLEGKSVDIIMRNDYRDRTPSLTGTNFSKTSSS